MKIGIDIDGVLTNTEEFLIHLGSKYNYLNRLSDMKEPKIGHLPTIFNWNQEQNDNFWDLYLEYFYNNNSIKPFAAEVIKILKEKGFEVIIITKKTSFYFADQNKTKKYQSIIKEWLKRNNVLYDEIIFTADSKEVICENKKIDIMIDDEEKNIIPISKNIPVICFDAHYNRKVKGPNVIRCYTWYDILTKIERFDKNGNIN